MKSKEIKKYTSLSEDDWHNIRNDAHTFLLSMHAFNKAKWQKGTLALPTQFLQIQAKFTEELLNIHNGWTAADRARIMTAQLLLYGSAGLPFMGDKAAKLIGGIFGMDEQESVNSPVLRGGLADAALSMIGVNSSVARRFSLNSVFEDYFSSLFSDQSVAETYAGASINVLKRLGSGARDFIETTEGLVGKGNYNPLVYGLAA